MGINREKGNNKSSFTSNDVININKYNIVPVDDFEYLHMTR